MRKYAMVKHLATFRSLNSKVDLLAVRCSYSDNRGDAIRKPIGRTRHTHEKKTSRQALPTVLLICVYAVHENCFSNLLHLGILGLPHTRSM